MPLLPVPGRPAGSTGRMGSLQRAFTFSAKPPPWFARKGQKQVRTELGWLPFIFQAVLSKQLSFYVHRLTQVSGRVFLLSHHLGTGYIRDSVNGEKSTRYKRLSHLVPKKVVLQCSAWFQPDAFLRVVICQEETVLRSGTKTFDFCHALADCGAGVQHGCLK